MQVAESENVKKRLTSMDLNDMILKNEYI